MNLVLPLVIVQKLGAFAAARAFRSGVRQGRTFERAYSSGRVTTTFREARRARELARANSAAQAGVELGSRTTHRLSRRRAHFNEGYANSRGVSNRLVVRTALSRRVRVPLSMRAGFLAGAARNRIVRVRDNSVRGGFYTRRAPA